MIHKPHRSGLLVPANFAESTSRRPDMREVATTRDGRDITRGYVDPMMIMQPSDSVLRLRGNGDYTIYQEVLRDDQVAACFHQRRLAVIGKEWDIDPGGTSRADKKAADHLREVIAEVGWDRITDRMLFGVYYGYAAAEVMWARDGAMITVDAIKVRDRRRFGWDGEGRLRLKTSDNPLGELLPDRKFWTFATGSDHDDEPYGLGLAHWLYWPVFFKRAGMRYWMTFLERFGQPTTVGKHPVGATPGERQKLLEALEAVNTDSGIAIPQGMEIEFLEAARSGTADYKELYEHMDNAIAKVTLGQVASTQGTPGKLGNDDLQGDVRTDLIKADADLVCESFNRSVVRWLTEYNYPGANPPRVYRMVMPEEDLTARAERDAKIKDLGYKPTLAYVNDTYGDGWEAATPEPTIPGAQLPPAPPGAAASFAEPALSPPAQMLDPARQHVEPASNAWIDQVRALAMEVDSLEALRDQLLTLYPSMTLDDYADAMAEATTAAELAGRSEIQDERNGR
jgi:phage gp29-like protein